MQDEYSSHILDCQRWRNAGGSDGCGGSLSLRKALRAALRGDRADRDE